MDDEELTEMAAKAIGYKIRPCTCSSGKKITEQGKHFDPLRDDTDAFMVLLSLKLKVFHTENSGAIVVRSAIPTICVSEGYHDFRDSFRATRRAIVRAAAEIGRSMP
jgi:hypothetical protein